MKTLIRARRIAAMVLLVLGLLLFTAAPSHGRGGGGGHGHGGRHRHFHRFHGGVFVGVGPWRWGPPWWYYPPPYYVYAPPPVIVQEPPVYIEQPAPPGPTRQAYGYYCPSAKGYYPSVPSCPEPWVRVAPRSQ